MRFPYQDSVQAFIHNVINMDEELFPSSGKSTIKKFKSDPYILENDSIKLKMSRDQNIFAGYPYVQLMITPFSFQITVSCHSFSREKADIIRSMAVNKTPLFSQAWERYLSHDDIKLEGKSYGKIDLPGARFYAYPREISSFLEHRTYIFNLYDSDVDFNDENINSDFIRNKVEIMAPFYHLLLAASEAEGTPYLDHSIFDPWNIDKPEAVQLAHENYPSA